MRNHCCRWTVLLLVAFRISDCKFVLVPNNPTSGSVFVNQAKQFSLSASVQPTNAASVAGVVDVLVGIPRNSVLNCLVTNANGCSSYNLDFNPSSDQAGANNSVCVMWSTYPTVASSVYACITLSVLSPQPVILQPSGSWYFGGRLYVNPNSAVTYSFRANVGCLMSVPFQVADANPNSPYNIVLKPLVQSSFPSSPTGLPQAVSGNDGAATLITVQNSFEFQWRPARGQESSKHYQVCFEATDVEDISASAVTSPILVKRSVCFRILVEKCQYCVQPGDSFGSISTQFNTDWLHIYTANPTILDPDNLVPYTRINTGVFYQVQTVSCCLDSLRALNVSVADDDSPLDDVQGDTPSSIAQRFFTTLDSLQSVNPDIQLENVPPLPPFHARLRGKGHCCIGARELT